MRAFKAISFPLGTALTAPCVFGDVTLLFLFSAVSFTSFDAPSLMHWLFRSVLINFQMFGDFIVFLSCWFFVQVHHVQRTHSVGFQVFGVCWDLFYGPGYGLSWWLHHEHLKNVCVAWCRLKRSLNVKPLPLGGSMVQFCTCWLSSGRAVSCWERGAEVPKCNAAFASLTSSPSGFGFCSGALLFDEYAFRLVMHSQWADPVSVTQFPLCL